MRSLGNLIERSEHTSCLNCWRSMAIWVKYLGIELYGYKSLSRICINTLTITLFFCQKHSIDSVHFFWWALNLHEDPPSISLLFSCQSLPNTINKNIKVNSLIRFLIKFLVCPTDLYSCGLWDSWISCLKLRLLSTSEILLIALKLSSIWH
jgi:hypothetical protein